MAKVAADVARAREQRAWFLRTREFRTHEEIALDLGVERSTVSKALKRLLSRVSLETEGEVRNKKMEQVAQLEGIAAEAMQAWRDSKKSKTRVTKRTRPGATAKGEEGVRPPEDVTQHAEQQTGNVLYLQEAVAALAEVRKILGLDAPVKSDVTSGGRSLEVRAYDYANSIAALAPGPVGDSEAPG